MNDTYKVTNNPPIYAKGSKYSKKGNPLQTNEKDYLCPECGGYGEYNSNACVYCDGNGNIALDDVRVTKMELKEI